MVRCSLCGSDGVNKSTCPLHIKNPTKTDFQNHPLAISLMNSKAPDKHCPCPKPPRKIYPNPYKCKMTTLCSVTSRLQSQYRDPKKPINLSGYVLQQLLYQVLVPGKTNIKLNNTPRNHQKFHEYLDIYCGVYQELAKLIVDRLDMFTRPDSKTHGLFSFIGKVKKDLLQFLVENRQDGDGGIGQVNLEN